MIVCRPIAIFGAIALVFLLSTATGAAAESLDCVIEPHMVVDLSSPEFGVLGSVLVEEADEVQAGDVVAALQDDVERAALDLSRARATAKAEIELLRHDHDFNKRKRSRIDKLENQLAVSTQSADEVRTAEELARLRLRAATEEQMTVKLEAARDELALKRRTVRSPINGVVAVRYKSAGEYVEGDPIVQLVQLDPLRVQAIAPIELYGQIKAGMRASVSPELPIDGQFEASVLSIDPVMDAATATFGVRLSLPNPGNRLPPGLRCTLVLHPASEPAPVQTASNVPANEPAPTPLIAEDKLPRESAPIPDEQCSTLGPIGSEQDADEIAAALSASNIATERRYQRSTEVSASWMVLSAEGATPADLLERVGQAGVRDFQLLRRGPWKDRMSFGTYSGRQAAGRRLQQVKELGFDVVLANRESASATVWLDLSRPADAQLISAVSVARGDQPVPRLQPRPCAQVASR